MPMQPNLDRYKKDLDALLVKGNKLHLAIQKECYPEEFKRQLAKGSKRTKDFAKKLPSFASSYQSWYSEALALVRQVLPDRLADFISHYQKPKQRKEITFENYKIEDYLQGLRVTRTQGELQSTVVRPDAAIPQFRQQLGIVESIVPRFESSLFEIRQLAQADLFDSELDAASELLKNKFLRAAGVVAGVVLEKHLAQVCGNHKIAVTKKNPTIADLNDLLKNANVYDVPQWRSIQFLADIRNLCGHNRKTDPTVEQVTDLIAGVSKITKMIF
jgi:hypothetical protein